MIKNSYIEDLEKDNKRLYDLIDDLKTTNTRILQEVIELLQAKIEDIKNAN